MSADVVEFTGISRLDIPAERVLDWARDEDLLSAIVIGKTADGELYFASSLADGGAVLWLLEVVKRQLLEAAEL